MLGLVLAAVGAAGYMTMLRGDGPPEPMPGEVVVLDPIQINLTKGHYLRLALALQLTEETAEVDGSKALDAAITLFSGRQPEDLLEAKERASLKSELVGELAETYEGEVMDVYFTEFVTQ